MQPGRIEKATRVLAAPRDWNQERDGKCGGHGMTSAWLPTAEELRRLAAGAAVHLTIVSNGGHPPVVLAVGEAPDQVVVPRDGKHVEFSVTVWAADVVDAAAHAVMLQEQLMRKSALMRARILISPAAVNLGKGSGA